ncbi:uncharacterized protein V6R79_018186, partial [Siganus canaliculatus]
MDRRARGSVLRRRWFTPCWESRRGQRRRGRVFSGEPMIGTRQESVRSRKRWGTAKDWSNPSPDREMDEQVIRSFSFTCRPPRLPRRRGRFRRE